MSKYLPQNPQQMALTASPAGGATLPAEHSSLADLRVFWGPEICRLEYLIHLLDTGRIKDPYWAALSAART